MAGADKPGRAPIDWKRMLPVAFAIGVGPAVGREVGAALREPWGYWPATLTGIAAAAAFAVAVFGLASLIANRGKKRPDG